MSNFLSSQMFSNDDDDDDDFDINIKAASSNLSKIFATALSSTQNDDKNSLKYVPVKPKKTLENLAKSNDNQSDWNVHWVKIVTAYKTVGNENVSLNKVGMALLKKRTTDFLRLILYRTKHDILSTLNLNKGVNIFVCGLYLQYKDDNNANLRIFLDEQTMKEVILEIKDIVNLIHEQTDEQTSNTNELALNGESKTDTVVDDIGKDPLYINKSSNNGQIQENASVIDNTAKENLLLRMARMGQSLPKIPTPTIDLIDSSDGGTVKPTITTKPKSNPVTMDGPVQTVIPSNYRNTVHINPVAIHQETQYMNMLMTENRTQNTELRMNISKLDTKIDRVLDKFDMFGNNRNDNRTNLELKANNTDNIKEIRELLLTTVETIKESNQAKLCSVEHSDKNEIVEHENTAIKEIQNILQSHSKEMQDKLQQLEVITNKLSHTSIDEELINHKLEIDKLKSENERLLTENARLKNDIDLKIKNIMSCTYNDLYEKLNCDENFTNTEIMKICAVAIKKNTENALKEIDTQNKYNDM